MRILETNLQKLALQLLPTCLRKPVLMSMLRYMVGPLNYILGQILTWRISTLRKLKYNGQTCNLERCLNDRLDPDRRRIRIEDVVEQHERPFYVYERGTEYADKLLKRGGSPCIMAFSRTIVTGDFADFRVKVPKDVADTSSSTFGDRGDPSRTMILLVNRHRLPGKRVTYQNY